MAQTRPPGPIETNGGEQPSLKQVMGPGLLLLFIIGDILGTGIYALTGQVAGEVGGAAWLPFAIAFFVALVTACSTLSWSPNIREPPEPRSTCTRRSARTS